MRRGGAARFALARAERTGPAYFDEHLNTHLDSYGKIDFSDGPLRLRTLIDIVIYGGLAHTHASKTKIFES